MRPAIRVENLSKRYRLGEGTRGGYRTFREALVEAAAAPFRGLARRAGRPTQAGSPREDEKTLWALKDVSFEVEPGEVVGLIGRNGAGKSTLLKVLSRITEPTSGRAELHGRVGSLLEVGTGFHPELTGRENIYLNGSILGMRRKEIDRQFDAIVAFSEIERFLDTPVKRFSSGMYVRLAFAVAAHLQPEILIVDEVLAVGDAQFQKKCMGKMGDVAQSGRTVLFVSHSMPAVRALCSKGILLEEGRVQTMGNVAEAVRAYQSVIGLDGLRAGVRSWEPSEAPGNERLQLLGVRVAPLSGECLDTTSGFSITLKVRCLRPIPNLDATIEIRTLEDVIVLHDGVVFTSMQDCREGVYEARFEVPGHLLNCGQYRLRLIFGQNQAYVVFKMDDVVSFEIVHDARRTLAPRPGVVRPNLQFESRYLGVDPRAARSEEFAEGTAV